MKTVVRGIAVSILLWVSLSMAPASEAGTQQRMFETSFTSKKVYGNAFNDVDVDVIFTRGTESWRVPAFWRGGNEWTVRFAPREPGEYTYRLESTDRGNPQLNGHERRVTIAAYSGSNKLLKRGAFRVSENKRYFEQADGAPFYWLGDTWYSGLSDRLPWKGFQEMTADRKAKGYTVIQMAMMTVSNEEDAPSDPGFCNEGGCVWDASFARLNPRYFDFADRRVKHLIDAEIAPALFGMWRQALGQMGLEKGKKFWRYLIARYGAYPVFWIAGGEVYDAQAGKEGVAGWTELVRYIRATDPYHHPLSAHEPPPAFDTSIADESLTDFDMFQPSHFGWASIRAQIAQLNMHYARTAVTKPLIVAEVGWEGLGGHHFEDFQRTAFWVAMLNGAAGFSYGNAMTGESYTADKPFHRIRLSFLNWDEAMHFPSTAQLGWGARLLQQYPWQRFTPHPEWVVPRSLTFLEPQSAINGFDIDLMSSAMGAIKTPPLAMDWEYPRGVWHTRKGDFRLPYAAGISSEVRFIYIPATGFPGLPPPTVLKLEPDVLYHAYYWEPSLGIKVDLGKVQANPAGEIIYRDAFESAGSNWERSTSQGKSLAVLRGVKETDVVAAVDARADAAATLILRYQDAANYLAAVYSPEKKAIYLKIRKDGKDGEPLGQTEIPAMDGRIRLTAEVRANSAVVSVRRGQDSFTSPIVDIVPVSPWTKEFPQPEPGAVGLQQDGDGAAQSFGNFELRRAAPMVRDERLEKELYDARGQYRGVLKGKNWDAYGESKIILLDAWRPEDPPFPQDWVLVLDARARSNHSTGSRTHEETWKMSSSVDLQKNNP